MKKNVITVIAVSMLLGICSLNAQEIMKNFNTDLLHLKIKEPEDAKKIMGSPYANSEFNYALVHMKETNNPITAKLRYNSYKDEMEFLREEDGQILILQNQREVESIELNNKIYVYAGYIEDNMVLYGYFECIYDNECKLFKRAPKEFQEEKYPKTGYENYVPPAYVEQEERFYAGFSDVPLVEIPRRNKKIQELFSEHGYENEEVSRVKYKQEDLIHYCRGLDRVDEG